MSDNPLHRPCWERGSWLHYAVRFGGLSSELNTPKPYMNLVATTDNARTFTQSRKPKPATLNTNPSTPKTVETYK